MKNEDFELLISYQEMAIAAITKLLRAGRKLVIAYSGGKDSTATLMIALEAARRLRAEGVSFPPVLLTHGNTGIENPVIHAVAMHEMAKARAYAHHHGFVLQAEVAMPLLNDTWAVAILSGRKLPTFASSADRDCTIMFKGDPMKRLRNRIFKSEKGQYRGGAPVTLVGTRFEESTGRAARMNERKETAFEPWVKDKAWFMSPIALWSSDEVMLYLSYFRDKKLHGFTDAADVLETYQDGGASSCVIVAAMATDDLKKKRGCGARFGCSLCAAVGRDKSLEAMVSLPKYEWMKNLNRIQRFIVDTQWDWSRRNWVGRTINNGFVNIEPDTYSPAMLQELLRYCLTADALEEKATYRMGIPPRFQLVTQEQLLAIDALWSINGVQPRPFTAIKIWNEVYNENKRFFPPDIEPVAPSPQPTTRYLPVGDSWDGDGPGAYTGLRDVLAEGFGGVGCIGSRTLKDGRVVANIAEAKSLEFDREAVDMFFQFEIDYVLRMHEQGWGCTQGIMHYIRLNMIATSEGHVQEHLDRIVRRTSWRQRMGLLGTSDVAEILPRTVSKAEMLQAALARTGFAINSTRGKKKLHAKSFTMGLAAEGLPELVICGMKPKPRETVLKTLGTQLRSGVVFTDGMLVPVGKKGVVRLHELSPQAARDELDTAAKAAGDAAFRAFQVLWADGKGLFPDEAGCHADCVNAQPLFERAVSAAPAESRSAHAISWAGSAELEEMMGASLDRLDPEPALDLTSAAQFQAITRPRPLAEMPEQMMLLLD